jgi:heptosyltransferase I
VSTPRRILIVRLGAMGDIIHAMPAVAALRKAFPRAEFGWIIESRWSELLRSKSDAKPRSEDQPLVDFVHLVDTRKWRKNLLARENRKAMTSALREVREMKYDVAIDFQGAIKSAAIGKLSGAPKRYGFDDPWEKGASLLYTDKVSAVAAHVVERNLELASAMAGTKWKEECSAQLLPTTGESGLGEKLKHFGLASPFAILNPGAGWGAKQWPTDRYAEVARALGKDGIRSLVNFGPGEAELARIVEERAGGNAIAAQFTISELIAVTRRASLFIGGDTGPMHLAAALKVPVVALFGPTDPARTGPYGTRSVTLRDPASITSHKRNRETEAGLMNITSEQVIAAARQLLAEGAGA